MQVSEIVGRDVTGELAELQGTGLWDKHIESLDNHRLLAHYALMKNQLGRTRAIHLMTLLKGECLVLYMIGDLQLCAMVDFRPPVSDLVAPNVLSYLTALPFHERAAVIVALAEKKPLADITRLKWSELPLNQWHAISCKVIGRVVPRLGCEYVFWSENVIGKPTSCDHLEQKLTVDLGVSWAEFAEVTGLLLRFEHFASREIEMLIAK